MENNYLFLAEAFWPSGFVIAWVCVCVSVCVSTFACPRIHSSPVQAKVT